jgi:hypothetical protein
MAVQLLDSGPLKQGGGQAMTGEEARSEDGKGGRCCGQRCGKRDAEWLQVLLDVSTFARTSLTRLTLIADPLLLLLLL